MRTHNSDHSFRRPYLSSTSSSSCSSDGRPISQPNYAALRWLPDILPATILPRPTSYYCSVGDLVGLGRDGGIHKAGAGGGVG